MKWSGWRAPLWLEAGECGNLTALAQGMLLCSGNDAANAAAIAIAGSTEEFAN